jgi:nitrile hydratase accessory protein
MDRANFSDEPCQPIYRGQGEAPFNDSWEAEAYAMGNLLVKLNHLSPKEWMDLMAESIKEAQNHGDPDTGDTYYNHWCRSIEKFCFLSGLSDPDQHRNNLDLWKKAINNTPHGVPLAIENAFLDRQAHHHDCEGHPQDDENHHHDGLEVHPHDDLEDHHVSQSHHEHSHHEHTHHQPANHSHTLEQHHSHERPATPPETYYAPIAIQRLKS